MGQLFFREILWWGGNFPEEGQFFSGVIVRWQIVWRAIVQRGIFLRGNCPWGQLSSGSIVQVQLSGGQWPWGGNYPGANFSRVELSGHQISHLFIWSFHNYRRSSLQLFCKIGVSQYSQKNIWARASFFKYSCRPATIFTKKGSYTYWKRCSDIGVFLTIFNNNFFNI